MKNGCCHLCGGRLFDTPVVGLKGMPKAAQYYPTADEFEDDCGISLNVFQCKDCGLVQLDAEPVDYFREVITAATFSEKARTSRLQQMQELVAEHQLSLKKVLEVGSGRGEMLDVMAEAGMLATGIEASEKSVEVGQAAGRNMICGYIGDTDILAGAPYEAFVSLNFLEHLPNPNEIIQTIHRNTTENAVGFVTVPNLDYLLDSRCYYEFVADHLSYFTQETLSQAFRQNGFSVLRCEIINNNNDILIVVRKRAMAKIEDQFGEIEELIVDLQTTVEKYTKVAVWGAGHRTLALLALAGLSGIEFVVDSAKFKQGRFTPVLHKEIVSPERLKDTNIDLIIVMLPGIYPDEVIKSIEKMDLDIKVASLQGNRLKFF